MKLQGGRELRQSVIYPSGGSVVLTARRLVKNWRFSVLDTNVMDMEWVEKLGLITVHSSHIPEPCAAHDRASAWLPVMRCTLTWAQSGLH